MACVTPLSKQIYLSSRIETGIAIDESTLRLVDEVEKLVRGSQPSQTVRCRGRAHGWVTELDSATLHGLSPKRIDLMRRAIAKLAPDQDVVRFEPYRAGSAFLSESA
jgi:pyridinium-3,5-biscarboxylic acid mononucleotide sulfurtransferase